MKVLVTGGAGYLGSILCPELLKAGYHVTVIDNFIYRQTSLLDQCYHPSFELKRGDVRDKKLIASLIRDADVIIPLACLVGAPVCEQKPLEAQTINLDAIKLILELRSKNQHIIFPTTNSGYGVGQDGIHCTEETPLRPISHYGRLKVEAEKSLLDSGNAVSLRLATVFGLSPRMRLDLLVNDFTYRAVVDRFVVLFEAHFKRNYIHIRDVSRAFIHAIENFSSMKDAPYNVGLSDANLSKQELCEVIKKHVPEFTFLESSIGKDPDQRNYIVSNEKIEKTGFKPQHSLEMGVRELLKGYQAIRRYSFSNL